MDSLYTAGLLEYESMREDPPRTWKYSIIPDRDADGNDVIYD